MKIYNELPVVMCKILGYYINYLHLGTRKYGAPINTDLDLYCSQHYWYMLYRISEQSFIFTSK